MVLSIFNKTTANADDFNALPIVDLQQFDLVGGPGVGYEGDPDHPIEHKIGVRFVKANDD
jgi:hypothetical protein